MSIPRILIHPFSTGDLVAWYLVRADGIQGMLHVMEPHRGKGLASCLLKYMHTVKTKALGQHDFVIIVVNNEPSEKLYLKNGFLPTDGTVTWIFAKRQEAKTDE